MRNSPESVGSKRLIKRVIGIVALPLMGGAMVYSLNLIRPALAESDAATKRDLEETGGVNLQQIDGTKSFIIRFRASGSDTDRITLLANAMRNITGDYGCEAVSPPVYYPTTGSGQTPPQSREAYIATCTR